MPEMSRVRSSGTYPYTVLVAALLAAFAMPVSARAAPDPVRAIESLVRGPLRVSGDLVGGLGLCLASGVALLSDGVSWIDDNRLTRPLLRGALSRGGHYAALGISHGSTGILELLRGEDIERLPEARATYLEAAPGYGRWTTFATGLAALELGIGDGLATVPLALLYAGGAETWAARLARRREEARTRGLGPLTPEAPPGNASEEARGTRAE